MTVSWCLNGTNVVSHGFADGYTLVGYWTLTNTDVLIASGGNGSPSWQAVRRPHFVDHYSNGFPAGSLDAVRSITVYGTGFVVRLTGRTAEAALGV